MESQILFTGISVADFKGLIRAEIASAIAAQQPNPNTPQTDEFLTVNEAVRTFKTSKVSLWKARRDGRLPAVTNGRKVLFRRSDLEQLLIPVTA